jgi:uracil-DNA glycosylase
LPTLEEIKVLIAHCRDCDLSKGRTQTVPGFGNPDAKAMFVGEAPGFYEDQQGRPFIGPAGQFLDKLLELAGFARKDVFITNVVKCRPPGNRDPEPSELDACDGHLRAQIAALDPKVIVTLGKFSLAKFVPNVRSMREIHGRAMPYEGRLVVAMYHPAAALHQGSLRAVIEDDFRTLPMIIARSDVQAAPAAAPAAPAPSGSPAHEQIPLFEALA